MDDPDIRDVLRYIYTPRKYSTLMEVLSSVETMLGTTELLDSIENDVKLYIMTNRRLPQSVRVDAMVHDYVETNIVNKVFNIILEDTDQVDLFFLAAITKLSLSLDKYSEAHTATILEYVSSDLDTYSMLGYILATLQPEFYPFDIINLVKNIPQTTIEEIKIRTDYVMDLTETDDDQLTAFYTGMTNLDQGIIRSKLFNYIIKYNNYDISDKSCVAYISSICEENHIDNKSLGLELLVFAALKHKDQGYMVNIIDSVFPEHNRHDIMYFLNTRLAGYDY